MPEERIHDHLVYQDIDLSKNKIKNVVALENTENSNAPTSISITANGNIPIKSNSDSGVISITQGNNGAVLNINGDHDVSITKANSFSVERTGKSPATKFEIASDGDTSLTNAKDVSTSGSGDISLTTYGGSASIQIPNDTHSIKLSKDNGTSFEIQSDNSVIIDKAKDFKSATGTGEIYFKTIGTQGENNSKNATIEVPADGNISLKKTGSTELKIASNNDVVLTDAGNISADGSGDVSITSTGGDATLTVPDNKSITLKKSSSSEGKIEIDGNDNINLYANTITTTGSGDYGVSITDGDIDLSTTAGDIGVSTNDGNIGVSTTEGNIDVSTDDGIVSITAESDTANTSSVSIQRIDNSSSKSSEINLNSDGSIDISSDNGPATIEVPSNKSIILKKTGSTQLEIEPDNDVTLTGARDISSTGSGNISVTSNGGDATITVPKAKSINLISKDSNDFGATLTLGGVESGTAHQNAVLSGADKIIASGAKDIEIKNDESGTSGVGGHLKIEKSSGNIELKGTGDVVIESTETNKTGKFAIVDGAPSIIGSDSALIQVPNAKAITIKQDGNNGASIGIDDSHNISLSGVSLTETGTGDIAIQNDTSGTNGGHLKINKGTGDIELKSNATNGGLSFVNGHGDGIKLTNGASGTLTVKAPGDISITNNDSTSGGYINITKSSGKVDIQSNGTNDANDASIVLDNGKITGVGKNDIRIGNDIGALTSGGYLEIKNSDSNSDATLKSKGNVTIESTTGTLTEKANGNITVESTNGTLTEKAKSTIKITNESSENSTVTGGGYLEITSGNTSKATLKAFKNFEVKGADGEVKLESGALSASGKSVYIGATNGTLSASGTGAVTLQSTGDSVSINATTSGKSITLDSPNITLKSGSGNSKIAINGTNNLSIQSGSSQSSVTSDTVTAKKGATVETGGITVEAGGIEVQSGGANITGNSKVTGDLEVTGVTTLNSQVKVYWDSTTNSLVFEKVAN